MIKKRERTTSLRVRDIPGEPAQAEQYNQPRAHRNRTRNSWNRSRLKLDPGGVLFYSTSAQFPIRFQFQIFSLPLFLNRL